MLDSVPAAARGRWGISSQQVTIVALLVATALAAAAWWTVQARPEPVAVGQPVLSISSPPPTATEAGPGAPSPSTTLSGADLVIHVAGKVRRPGIVELPPGSRVIDALQAVGGQRRGVDLSGLNLARPLVDGEQVVVGGVPGAPGPVAAPPTVTTGLGPTGGVVNLNTATTAQLEELPGVGPVTAASILAWRDEHGRFSSVDELLEVSGIGDVTLAELRDFVTV